MHRLLFGAALIPWLATATDIPPLRDLSRTDLLQARDETGALRHAKSAEDWQLRRHEALEGFQRVAGRLPGETFRSPLEMRVMETVDCGSYERRLIEYQSSPGGRVPDLDPTACLVYGQQELGMFSTHVGDTCLMPFHLYEGQSGRLIATALHPGKTPAAKAILGILRRVVKKLRQVWPRLPLIFRADGHHSKPEVIAWLEREGLDYVIGYAPNAVLKRQFANCLSEARKRYERQVKEGCAEVEARAFASGSYSAGSWRGQQRRNICRAIASPNGVDERFIVTSFEQAGARKLYETIYCGRGRAEIYIKDHKLGLVSDRLNCTRKEGNAMRLLCSSLAYHVLEGFRRIALSGTKLARATFGEMRIKLFKLAARVRVTKTRVEVHLAGKHPGSALIAQIIGQALQVLAPRTAGSAPSSG